MKRMFVLIHTCSNVAVIGINPVKSLVWSFKANVQTQLFRSCRGYCSILTFGSKCAPVNTTWRSTHSQVGCCLCELCTQPHWMILTLFLPGLPLHAAFSCVFSPHSDLFSYSLPSPFSSHTNRWRQLLTPITSGLIWDFLVEIIILVHVACLKGKSTFRLHFYSACIPWTKVKLVLVFNISVFVALYSVLPSKWWVNTLSLWLLFVTIPTQITQIISCFLHIIQN